MSNTSRSKKYPTTLYSAGHSPEETEGSSTPITDNTVQSWSGLVIRRQSTHGPFHLTAATTQRVKDIWKDTRNWPYFSPIKREALEQITGKISRACNGNPDEPDHWHDIIGYVELILMEMGLERR